MPVGQELGAAFLCPLALRTSEDHSQYHPGRSHLKAWLGKDPPWAHPHRCWQDPVPCRLMEVDGEGMGTHTLLARDLPHFSAMRASPPYTGHLTQAIVVHQSEQMMAREKTQVEESHYLLQ